MILVFVCGKNVCCVERIDLWKLLYVVKAMILLTIWDDYMKKNSVSNGFDNGKPHNPEDVMWTNDDESYKVLCGISHIENETFIS